MTDITQTLYHTRLWRKLKITHEHYTNQKDTRRCLV